VYDVVVKKFTLAISAPDEFLVFSRSMNCNKATAAKRRTNVLIESCKQQNKK